MNFGLIKNSQIDQAYQILCNRIDDLIIKKTGQYIGYYPSKEVFRLRNQNNQNWCLSIKNKIIGIVSIIKNEFPIEWEEITEQYNFFWISSLFIDINEKGKKYGQLLIQKLINKAKNEEINYIYLDCYMDSNYLVQYYENNGFIKVNEKEFIYGERHFSAALMKIKV